MAWCRSAPAFVRARSASAWRSVRSRATCCGSSSGQGVRVVSVGLLAGLAAAWALSRALTTFVPLAHADWLVFGALAIALGALAAWACYLPALRATRVPAMTALRHE